MAYNRKDHLYKKAKDSGLRSRAAYKLLELDRRTRCLKKGIRVLDLGCWPGGWLQIASSKIGAKGRVVGIDLKEIDPLKEKNVHFVCGDAQDEGVQAEAMKLAGGQFNLILSDMSPKHTGIRDVDEAQTVQVAQLAYDVATKLLQPGGVLIIKVFPSQDLEEFQKRARTSFKGFRRLVLNSTRKTSKEFYLVGSGYIPAEAPGVVLNTGTR